MDTSLTLDILFVLNGEGDTTISWNPANPADVADARAQVEALRAQGYAFFLVDGSPAPATITAGLAVLNCRRIPAEAVVQAAPPVEAPPPPPAERPPEQQAATAAPLTQLGLGPRPRAALRQANLLTFDALVRKTEADLLALVGFGAGSLDIVKAALAVRGLSLAGPASPPAAPAAGPRRVVASRPTVGG